MKDKLYNLVMTEMGYAKALDLVFFLVHNTGENESYALLQAAKAHKVDTGQLLLRWNALKSAAN